MAIARASLSRPTDYGILTRSEAIAEFQYRHDAGQHVLFMGPTGRGKTTLARQLLARPATDDAIVCSIKGKDPALQGLGKPVKDWPPTKRLLRFGQQEHEEPPRIKRWEPELKRPSDLLRSRETMGQTLAWLWSQHDWTLYIPDLQVVSDPKMMGLGKPLEALILTARSRGTSIWMDAQAPRWIPRASTDQTSHLFLFKTRDRQTVQRLREIAGLDMGTIEEVMSNMDYHDVLWIDAAADEYYHVVN